ncbi:DNA oxidative demethylase AlkB [Marinobacter caseinilyticus]|uniref:DNA oxidative demethylase AlkB n=1 Tax=Marinobacter caseinilyticus TaxID=2692195 RepID=UPI00140AD9A0|nr:DNA oxidative demethylase AlkB [Marinobacter caseinilyticus]
MTADLFGAQDDQPWAEHLSAGTVWHHGLAVKHEVQLMTAIADIERQAGFRHMVTPGGFRMSAAMTNCGQFGWVTDQGGYRYAESDPQTGKVWPDIPECFLTLASAAAAQSGYPGFQPDACLINRYEVGSRMSLHQDKNEQDFSAPIVSVSLGLPVQFQFGGLTRKERPARLTLEHGDVIVWGGPDRLRYHGVGALKSGEHRLLGACRINLTFRKAG